MSEYGDMCREYSSDQKERRTARLPRRQGLIMNLQKHGFHVRQITEYQFRVTYPNREIPIDIYPIHLKWHNIKTGKRGQVPGEKYLKMTIEKQMGL